MNADTMEGRAAIEALRSGVPSRAAVASLGSTQETIKSQFQQALERSATGDGCIPVVFEASFGEGKSHLLGYLSHLAHETGWASSYVVISPGVPLGNAVAVLQELARQATVKGFTGRALRELATDLDIARSEQWSDFRLRVDRSDLDERLKALVALYEQMSADPEYRVRILEDIEGAPMLKSEISRRLKECGQAAAYNLRGGPKNAALAHDRLRLFAWMLRAMGQEGLVVLVDEVERMATFSLKQRLAAYRELAWWREIANSTESFIVPVFALSTGVMENVLDGDARLLSSGQALASDEDPALQGIGFMRRQGTRLDPITPEQVAAIRYTVRDLYQRAYEIQVRYPADRQGEQTIRQGIRYWITCWDLARYYPEHHPDIRVDDVATDDREIPDEDLASEGEEAGEE